jgi:hypothetical protein
MNNLIKKAPWIFKQPLTKIPKNLGTQVSDLFVWRSSENWKTFFELINLPALFTQDANDNYVNLILFDCNGNLLFKKKIQLLDRQRLTIDLDFFLNQNEQMHRVGEFGTFAVFHSYTPPIVQNLNAFISERGYVSYQYKNAPLRSYVHGNLDAISFYKEKFKPLGGRSFLQRQYQLQYEFSDSDSKFYEVLVTNPCARKVKVTCATRLSNSDRSSWGESVIINPKGVYIFKIMADSLQPSKCVITSHLIMSRPLVFRINQNQFDVFHG